MSIRPASHRTCLSGSGPSQEMPGASGSESDLQSLEKASFSETLKTSMSKLLNWQNFSYGKNPPWEYMFICINGYVGVYKLQESPQKSH